MNECRTDVFHCQPHGNNKTLSVGCSLRVITNYNVNHQRRCVHRVRSVQVVNLNNTRGSCVNSEECVFGPGESGSQSISGIVQNSQANK